MGPRTQLEIGDVSPSLDFEFSEPQPTGHAQRVRKPAYEQCVREVCICDLIQPETLSLELLLFKFPVIEVGDLAVGIDWKLFTRDANTESPSIVRVRVYVEVVISAEQLFGERLGLSRPEF